MDVSSFSTPSTITTEGKTVVERNARMPERGTLLILFEVHVQRPPFDTNQIYTVIETIIHEYFSPLNDRSPAQNDSIEKHLERVARKINRLLPDILYELEPRNIQKSITLCIGVLHEEGLFFTKTSSVRILLQHNDKLLSITDEDEQGEGEFLSFITSGTIAKNDSILITTSSLLDYFSLEKIKKVLSDNDSHGATNEIRQLVDEFAQQTFFQAIVVRSTTRSPINAKGRSGPAHHSIAALNSMEAATGDLLTNSFWSSTKKSIDSLTRHIKHVFSQQKNRTHTSKHTLTDEAIKMRKRERNTLRKILYKGISIIRSTGLVIVWIIQRAFTHTRTLFEQRHTLTKNITRVSRSLPRTIVHAVTHIRQTYKNLDNRRRTILMISAGLVVILIISIITSINNKKETLSQEELLAFIEEVEVKHTSAQAAIIYGNNVQAASLIAEARRLLQKIETNKSDIKERKTALATSLFESYKQVQKLEEIKNPTIIADITEQVQSTNHTLNMLSGTGNIFYGLDNTNTIYRFSISQEDIAIMGEIPEPVISITYLNNDELLIYTSNPEARLGVLNLKKQEFTEVAFTFNNPLSTKEAIVPYSSRLYVLDPRERQIFRHQLIGATYAKGQPWVDDSTVDLSDARTMTIDGGIWVITKTNGIIHLTAGVREAFTIAALDPPLNDANFIWTSIDSANLYILDPPTRRFIIASKEGQIVKQFVSETFDDLKSAIINEEAGEAYLLNRNMIYQVDFK